MKILKITPPKGYEIDKEKSTFEEIVFKPMKNALPKSWEELETIEGYFVRSNACVEETAIQYTINIHKNIFATEAQARASIALAQLSQLREVYRGGWQPNWNNLLQGKFSIEKTQGNINPCTLFSSHSFLCFQSTEVRDEFLKNFKDLIEEASPLLFG